ncbi:MAG: DedA family protein, partial [Candidatus Pacebacteria bacterium]|nr:DedA family protein [Candidatus Paceibacterota bacterium]
IGYWIGRRGGRALLERIMRRFKIKPDHLIKAENFFTHHGGKAVFFGRSVSYLRVLTALLAGVSHMHYPRFLLWNALGGVAWALFFGLAAYYFGQNLTVLELYIREIAWGALGVAVLGAAVYFLVSRLKKNKKPDSFSS